MKIVVFSNTDWFMYNFNLSLAFALREKGYDVLLVSPSGPYGQKLLNMGFKWIAAPMARRSLNPFREFLFIIWLVRLFFRERVDLVHAFTIKCAIYGAIAAKLCGIRSTVNSVTGMGYVFSSNEFKARLLRPLVRLLLKFSLNGKFSRLVVLNNDDYLFFKNSKLVDSEIIRIIPGAGVDCNKYMPQPTNKIEKFRVLLPARMLWDKGVAEFVEASRLVRAKGRDIEFLLAGAPDLGNPASVPEEKIQEWVGEGVITWLGHVNDMPSLFNSVSVVVLPSYREGLPTGLTEAGACGKPLVATDVPGCRDVIKNNVDGVLVPVKNPQALADALMRLQDDPKLCERLGSAARAKVIEEFEESIVISKTFGIYGQIDQASREQVRF